MRPRQPATAVPPASPLEQPFQQLAALPRTLWLPALVCHTGTGEADTSAQRLADLQRWRSALARGELPADDAHFGDPTALAPLRNAAGALGLAGLCRASDALSEQLLRSLLWHLDRLIDLQPRLDRAQAIAQITTEFSSAWTVLKGDWDAVLALLHPVLHKLWRVRRAEGRLLAYDSEAVLIDWRPDPAQPLREASAPPEPEALERGPIIICLDTSGSMRGAPERVAKAVVLQAVRTAHAERRACRLIAFGGPDEIIEQALAGGTQPGAALAALLDLMGQGFDGGTDLQGPIARAIDRVHEARWASADLLIVSDGEFGCTADTLDRLDAARAQFGLRVQGVLVGDRETIGLMAVADPIFWVRDWRRHGPGAGQAGGKAAAGFSPVHSKSLTALYFPGALPERAARHKPG